MNRRVETKVGQPNGVATGYLINREATEVYWITCSPNVFLTPGVILVYDGFDTGGKIKWEQRPGQCRHQNFIPPIHCEQGVFVDCSVDMGSFTIAWRPKKWNRPSTMKADEIIPPKEE
ncbi:hypothetical protein ES708_19535 [subsurface metagenome]